MPPLRIVYAIACLLLAAWSLAAVGEPPQVLLAELGHEAVVQEDGSYRSADGFVFRLELRGGVVYRLTGEGTLTERNAAFLADLIAAGTGYGSSIAGPVHAFLGSRAEDLAGRGEVSVGVEEYRLGLDVSGEDEARAIRFTLELQEFAKELFPDTAHALGPADARYVIREFSDFQCPFCANFAQGALPAIKQRLLERGDVRFEYHHFPLDSIHANATPAALAAECVTASNDEDDFWTYHDALFESQGEWQGLRDPQPFFVGLADQVGLTTDGVATCLDEGRYAEIVRDSYHAAAGPLRLTGTPSVFLNGYKVQDFLDPQAYLDLIEVIDAFSLEP